MTDYNALIAQARALISGVPHLTANLANLSALIFGAMDGLNWAGFYLLHVDTLVLGPFQGKPACIEIPVGRGVCGTAVSEGRPQLVRDVREFPGHIACDSASASELVVPITVSGRCVGVLDLDSPTVGRFTSKDEIGCVALVRAIEREIGDLLVRG